MDFLGCINRFEAKSTRRYETCRETCRQRAARFGGADRAVNANGIRSRRHVGDPSRGDKTAAAAEPRDSLDIARGHFLHIVPY